MLRKVPVGARREEIRIKKRQIAESFLALALHLEHVVLLFCYFAGFFQRAVCASAAARIK
jgi:hypothetical protein